MSDKRETVNSPSDFYPIVKSLFEQRQPIAILFEDAGVTRSNGIITALYERDGKQWMELNNDTQICIDQLYAVNGIFTSDYSEC